MEQKSCPMGKPVCEVRCAWYVKGNCSELLKLEIEIEILSELRKLNEGKKKK